MPENKKYFWLKLKEDFFEEDTISWIEEQQNGKEYVLFYLKLCLKALRNNGILIRTVGNMLIPYDCKKLSEITNTDIDTVRIAMELFKKINLVQILENGEIYLNQLQNMVGSETNKAESMRRLRERRKNSNIVTEMLPKSYIEKDIDIEKDKELDKEQEIELLTYCQNEFGRLLSSTEMQMLINLENEHGKEKLILAIQQCVLNNQRKINYLKGILRNWIDTDIDSIKDNKKDKKENEKSFKDKLFSKKEDDLNDI